MASAYSRMTLSELVAQARAPEPPVPATARPESPPLRLLRRSEPAAKRSGPLKLATLGFTMIAALAIGFAIGMSAGSLVEDNPAPRADADAATSGPKRVEISAAPAATTSRKAEPAADARGPQADAMLQGYAAYQRSQLAASAEEEARSPSAANAPSHDTPAPVATAPEAPAPVSKSRESSRRRPAAPASAPGSPAFTPRGNWQSPGYTAR